MGFLDEQLNAYLRDVHAIEQQALPQLRTASELAGDFPLANAFRQHLVETEHHEQLLRDRLEARGVAPTRLQRGFRASQPDTPAKLLSQALSFEHLEAAAHELLRRLAELAGDQTSFVVAGAIRESECAMAERLEASFDRAVDASLREVGRANIDDRLDRCLAEAHATEGQAIELLERGHELAGDAALADLYEQHLADSREHQRLVRQRLEARGGQHGEPDPALPLGAIECDTPAKLAAFAYAFEFLEVGGYEQLKRVARRAGDHATELLAERIVIDERDAADHLWDAFEPALEASLAGERVHA